jgi:O-acetyl-ADP-ribose deacetylase (regulator of RNase III)
MRAGPAPAAPPRSLTIDGLWIGIVPTGLADQNLPDDTTECVPVETRIIIDGVFDRVTIKRATLDPGGERARIDPLIGTPIPYVALEVRGQVEELVIENAIVGPIREASDAGDPCSIGRLTISDSIVQSLTTDQPAISTRVAAVTLARTTVFGDVSVDRLDATDSLIQGVVRVVDNQHGCFRFSAAADAANNAPPARLPRQYRSQVLADGVPNHWFVARRFGAAGYAQLSETCPASIRRGGENGSEMGVFNSVLDAIRRDDVRVKLDEYAPIGVIADLVVET